VYVNHIMSIILIYRRHGLAFWCSADANADNLCVSGEIFNNC